jgi:O-antigen/teichoic acid export membrane protein
MAIVFFASLLNIGLNYILIPKYGAVGATVATVISYWFVTHGSCFFHKSLHRTGAMITKAFMLAI